MRIQERGSRCIFRVERGAVQGACAGGLCREAVFRKQGREAPVEAPLRIF